MKFYNPSFLNERPSEKRKSLDKKLHNWCSDFWGSYQGTKKTIVNLYEAHSEIVVENLFHSEIVVDGKSDISEKKILFQNLLEIIMGFLKVLNQIRVLHAWKKPT